MTVTNFASALEVQAETEERRRLGQERYEQSRRENIAPLKAGLESLKESGRHLLDLGEKSRARMEFGFIAHAMEQRDQDELTAEQYKRFVDRYEDVFPNIRRDESITIDKLKFRSSLEGIPGFPVTTTGAAGVITAGFAPFSALFEVLNTADEHQKSFLSPFLWGMNFVARFADELARVEQTTEERDKTIPGIMANWINSTTGISLGDPDFVVDNIDDYKLRYFIEDVWNELAPPLAQLGAFKAAGKVSVDVGIKAPVGFFKEYLQKDGTFGSGMQVAARKALGIRIFKEKSYSPEEVVVLDAMEKAERSNDRQMFEGIIKSHPDMLIEYSKLKESRFGGVEKMKEIVEKFKKKEPIKDGDRVYLVNWAERTFRERNSSHESFNELIKEIQDNPATSKVELVKQFDSLMAEFTGMFMSHPRFWEAQKQGFKEGVEIGKEFVTKGKEFFMEEFGGSKRASVPVGSLVPGGDLFRRRTKEKKVIKEEKEGVIREREEFEKGIEVVVDGKPVKIHPELETFISEVGDKFVIHEARTGLPLAEGTGKMKAIKMAKEKVEGLGIETVKEMIESKIKEFGEEAVVRAKKVAEKPTGEAKKPVTAKEAKEPAGVAKEPVTAKEAQIRRSTKELQEKARVNVDGKIQRKALREKVKADPNDVKAAKELSEFNKKLSKKQSVSRQEVEGLAELAPESIRGEVMKQAKGIPLDSKTFEDVRDFFYSQGYRISNRGTFRSRGTKIDKALDKFDKTGEYSEAEWADLDIQAEHLAQMRQWDIAKTDTLNATLAIEEAKALKATEKLSEKQIKKIQELADRLEDKKPKFLFWDKLWSPINMLIEKIVGSEVLGERAMSLTKDGEIMMSKLQEQTQERWARIHDAMKLSRDKELMTQANQIAISEKVGEALEGKTDLKTDPFFDKYRPEVREEAQKLFREFGNLREVKRKQIINHAEDMIEFSKEQLKGVSKEIGELNDAISWVDEGSRIQIEFSKLREAKYNLRDDLFRKKAEMTRVKEVMVEGGKKDYMPHLIDSDYLDVVAKYMPEVLDQSRVSALTMDNKHLIRREDFPFYERSPIAAFFEYEKSLNRLFLNDKLTFELRRDALNQGYHPGTVKGEYLGDYITQNLKGERPGRETIGPTAEKIVGAVYGSVDFLRNTTGAEMKFLDALLERKKIITKKEMDWIKENGLDIEKGFEFKELPNGEIEMTTKAMGTGPFELDRSITFMKKLGYSGTIGMNPRTTMLNLTTQPLLALAYSGLGFFSGMADLKESMGFALKAWDTGEKGKAFRQKLRDAGLFVTSDSLVSPEATKLGKLESGFNRFLDKTLINMPISEYIARTSSARIGAIAFRKGKLTKADVGELITIDGVELSVKWADRYNFSYGAEHVPFFANYPLGRAFLFLGTFTLKQTELHRDIFIKSEFKDFFRKSEDIMKSDLGMNEKGQRIWEEYAKNRNRLGITKEAAYGLIAAMLWGQIFDLDFNEFIFSEGISISNPITNLLLGAGGWNQGPFDTIKPFIPLRGSFRTIDKTLGLDILSDYRNYGNVPQVLFPNR